MTTPAYKVEPTRDLLLRAAATIRERGLARRKFIAPSRSGAVCALGACAVAAGLDTDDAGYMGRVMDFLAEVLEPGNPRWSFYTVTHFSDAAFDAEEVAKFLERAAEEADE